MKIYNLKSPTDLTESVMSDIIADLMHLSKQSLASGKLVSAAKIDRMINLGQQIIEREVSERAFMEGADV